MNLSVAQAVRKSVTRPMNPNAWIARRLFARGEQGAWYDPSDLSTMFQEIGTSIANSTPVTATGQPVGLILDKSQGLVRGVELVVNGDFSNGSTGWSVSSSSLTVVNGVGRHAGLAANAASQRLLTLDTSKYYELSFDVPENTDSLSTTVNVREGAATTQCIAITVLAGATGRFSGVFKPTTAASRVHIKSNGTGISTGFVGFDNVSIREIPGNHASQTTPASRPMFRDVSGKRYLEFDGIDDSLATGSIVFTGTDKVSVFAGARKASDAVAAVLMEFGDSSAAAGTFALFAPLGVGQAKFDFRSRGSIAANVSSPATFASPATAVVTGIGDIANDICRLRVNGTSDGTVTTDQGTGSFGTAVLNIGRRGASSLPFTGNLYGLIVRGALSSPMDIIAAERFLALKAGVTLP